MPRPGRTSSHARSWPLVGALLGIAACNPEPPHSLDQCLLQANRKNEAEAIRLAQEGCREVFRFEAEARAQEQKQSDPLMRIGGYHPVGPQRCSMLQWGSTCYAKGCLCYSNRYADGVLLCDKERGGPTRVLKVAVKEDSLTLTPEDGGAPVSVFRNEVDCLRASLALAPAK